MHTETYMHLNSVDKLGTTFTTAHRLRRKVLEQSGVIESRLHCII